MTIAGVLLTLRIIQQRLSKQTGDTDLTKTIKNEIMRYMEEKYDDPATQELLKKASFLHPGYKTRFSCDIEPIIRQEAALITDHQGTYMYLLTHSKLRYV